MKKLIIFLMFLSLILGNSRAYALSLGVSSNANLSIAEQQALAKKQDISTDYKRSETIGVYSLFLPFLTSLEYHIPYFQKCSIVTNPKTLNDLLKHSVNTPYGIDTNSLQYIQSSGQIGRKDKLLSQRKIKHYALCLAVYGLIVSQAFKTFTHRLNGYGSALSNQVYKMPNNVFYNEIASSLIDAMKNQDLRLKTTYDDIKKDIKDHTCVLIDRNIKCGGVFVNFFSGVATESYGGIEWFDPSKDFAGRNDIISIGYSNSNTNERSLNRHRAINWTDDNAANINSDLFHSLF